ncbi:MAG: prolyl oligopeptidase family serine peptidase [Thermoanaerobaculia bacterium]
MTRARLCGLRTALAALVVLVAFSPLAFAQTDFSKVEIKAEKVGEGVYMMTGAGGNLGVSAGEDGVVLIDDQFAPLSGKILAAIRMISEKPVRFVINTHLHGDHVSGNENLARGGVLIVAHENVRKRMSVEQVSEVFKRTTPAYPKVALPVVTFTDAITIHVNGDDLVAFHVPPAHTDGDTVIRFAKANVIQTGDLFFNGNYPVIDLESGGSVEGMIAAADRILALSDAKTKLIPGHGPVASPADLRTFREMLAGTYTTVKTLVQAGKTREEVLDAKPTAPWDEKWGKGFMKPDLFTTVLFLDADARLHPKAPKTRAENVTETLHGVAVADPYRWLEDQSSPETRAWIEAQNRYADAILGVLPGRAALVRRLEQLLKIDQQGIPREAGGRYFYSARKADQEQPILYVRQGLSGKEEVLVDPHPMSPDRTVTVNFVDISDDGKLVACGTRQGGEDEVTVSILDVDTKALLPDRFPRARYSGFAITTDHKTAWYGKQTENGPRVYRHTMGADPAKDEVVFGDGYGKGIGIGVSITEDGKWLQLGVSYGSAGKNDIWVKDLSKNGPVTPIVQGLDAEFSGRIAADRLFVRTDWKAPNGRVLRIDLGNPAPESWKEIVPEGKAPLQGISLAGGRLFVSELPDVASRVRIFDTNGRPLGTLPLPGIGSGGGVAGRWGRDEAFFTFTSFNVPPAIYRYDVKTNRATEWWRSSVPVDMAALEVKQVFVTSKDGTKVPMFLVHRKGLVPDGKAPVWLTGYGGFRISQTPSFRPSAVLWAERGGVYAVAGMRGGGEYGEEWHKAGMLAKKQNVFDDFIASAEWLIANRYTTSEKLAISGGSNGGLLVGAVMTQRPELYRAVICSVPLLDMVRYDKFKIAKFWVPEYGTADDPEQFKILYGYSPYHHVKDGTRYPAVLFVSGDSDTRVDPLHARKMTARMQKAVEGVPGARPVLLHYDTKSGHSGGKPVSKTVEDTADELQFLFSQLGAAPGA